MVSVRLFISYSDRFKRDREIADDMQDLEVWSLGVRECCHTCCEVREQSDLRLF